MLGKMGDVEDSGLHIPGGYQPSNLKIVAEVIPEIVPERTSDANRIAFSGSVAGLALRHFTFIRLRLRIRTFTFMPFTSSLHCLL
jgi:hypothetical protein